jgi:hypothetical protein
MNENTSKREKALYKPISDWLEEYLKNKNPTTKVSVYDVHSVNLSDFLERTRFKKFFLEYPAYKIKVDLVGVIQNKNRCALIFVEVKDTEINLMHVSQLFGYCRIVRPAAAFLISPRSLSKPLKQLLIYFKRIDILEYIPNYFIRIARWDNSRNAIRIDSVIPSL